jgi:hypothetical protein
MAGELVQAAVVQFAEAPEYVELTSAAQTELDNLSMIAATVIAQMANRIMSFTS